MTGDQQYNLGNGRNPFQIDFGKLKSGIKAEEFKDNSAMLEIFNASDTNKNEVLDQNEVSVFVDKLVNAAGEDTTLSERETRNFLRAEKEAQEQAGGQSSQVKVKASDVFSFLNKWQNWSQTTNVKSSEVVDDQRIVTYEDGAQEVINKDGSKVVTHNSGATTIIASYNKDGKLVKEEKTDNQSGVVETILYDDDGSVKEHTKTLTTDDGETITQFIGTEGFANGKPVKEIIDDGSGNQIVSEFDYTGENNYTKTTTSANARTVVTVNNNEPVSANSVRLQNGIKVGELQIDYVNNTRTETSYNSEGQILNQLVVDGNDNSATATAFDPETGRRVQSVKVKDNQQYVANYDGNGNTLVIVQNGETVQQLSQVFDRTQGELAASNKGVIHRDANGQYYFLVGQEIRIAGELDPEHAGLQGRHSAEEEISAYSQQEFQRVAERLNGRPLKEVTVDKDYANLTEFAKDLLKSEGIENPTNQQITDKTNELIVINGNIVPRQGQVLSSAKTDAEIQQEARIAEENAAIQRQRESAAEEGAEIANVLKSEIDAVKTNSIGKETFQTALHKITPDNVVETLAAYDELSPDESLAEAMSWELTSSNRTIASSSEYILNQLIQRAENSGVDKSVINELTARANDAIARNKASDMGRIFQGFAQAIRNIELLSKDEVNEARLQTSEQQQASAVAALESVVGEAEDAFNNQLDSDGWAGWVVDRMSGAWGSQNREKLVRQDIETFQNQINELKNAKTEAEFKAKFKEIYGIDYDPVQVAAYEKMHDLYRNAAHHYAVENSFNNTTSLLRSSSVLTEERRVDYVQSVVPGRPSDTRVTITSKEQVYERELGKFAEFLGMGDKNAGMAQINDAFREAGLENASIDEKYAFLSEKANACSELLHQQTMAATGGKDFETIQNQYENSYIGAFGTENDIALRVNKYNDSQQVGATVLKSGVKIVAGVVIGICTYGAGVVPLLAAASAQTAVSFAVDASDLASSKNGGTAEQYLTIARNSAIDGVSQFVSGGASQIIKGANLGRVATYALNTATDTAVDMGVEYLQTGEVTWQSTLMSAGFSLGGQFVGDAIETRQQRKADRAVASQWADMSADQQMAYVANDPRWSSAMQADIDPLYNNDLIPRNWSSLTDEQKVAFNQQRQIASNRWRAMTAQSDIDPMLRPIPAEYQRPADFDSLPKEEQRAFNKRYNDFLKQRQIDHANWLETHQGVSTDGRSSLTSGDHHRYVQDYSSESLGRGAGVDNASGTVCDMSGNALGVGERADISYQQYVDARVDGEMFRSAGLSQDITDLEVRMYSMGAANHAVLYGADVNTRDALSKCPKAVELHLDNDRAMVNTAHDLSVNAYSGKNLPADSGLQFIDEIKDPTTGLRAKAYKGADGKIFIAYEGSCKAADFRVDHQMLDGHLPDQFAGAVAFKDRIKQQFPDSQIIVTGHSLGGSLSQLVASSDSDLLAITFDAVGMKNVVNGNNLNDFGNCANYIVKGDVISNMREQVGATAFMEGNTYIDPAKASAPVRTVTDPYGKTVTIRENSPHDLSATNAGAMDKIRIREEELDAKILRDAPPVADISDRNYAPKYEIVETTTAEATNAWWKAQGYTEPPYLPNTEVQIIELTEPTTFVRVLDGDSDDSGLFGSGVFGGWVMKQEDLLKPDGTMMSPFEIQQKFALKTTPTHIVDVTFPAGTKIRTGEVNPLPQWNKKGGGIQYDLMGQRVGRFDNARRLVSE
ncbi:hypothetical protein IKE67_02200 [bacterium]|nr:hypothetical protein [bacterium]